MVEDEVLDKVFKNKDLKKTLIDKEKNIILNEEDQIISLTMWR